MFCTIKQNMSRAIKSLGLCLGASTVSMVEVVQEPLPFHRNRPVLSLIPCTPMKAIPNSRFAGRWNLDVQSFDCIAATGRNSGIRQSDLDPGTGSRGDCLSLRQTGRGRLPGRGLRRGETFMVYVLDRSGRIANVVTGNKCASGTGEFFLQQLRRMNVSLEEAAQFASVEKPYHVSGRCSVFCKSDCTHATNKGIPRPKVTAGLCQMMANKILELLKKVERARHHDHRRHRPQPHDARVPAAGDSGAGGARGGPLLRGPRRRPVGLFKRNRGLSGFRRPIRRGRGQLRPPPAVGGFPPHGWNSKPSSAGPCGRRTTVCILGLDVGSTTTKAVLLRRSDHALLASVYLRTNGDPVGASRQCYRAILDQVRRQADPQTIRIVGLGVTGSGRQIAGLHALTDGVINEIIAHATAAVYFDPEVDTIFEIGGQDAKYTYITNGVPSDYAMNEACSAGTGSFLEESAYETLGVAHGRHRGGRVAGPAARPTSTTSAPPSSPPTSRTRSMKAFRTRTSSPAWCIRSA